MIFRPLLTASISALIASSLLLTAQAEEVSFVSCPIYRNSDAGKKSGCWLADDPTSAIRYDVTQSAAKPDWNYAVLVEGYVDPDQDDAGLCGGVVLKPIRVSVLYDQACTRHMLPAETYSGRKFVLPKEVTPPMSVPRTPPEPPFEEQVFGIYFTFDQDFITYQQSDYYLDKAITWIRGTDPSAIKITGFADTEGRSVTGVELAEREGLAQVRAEKIAFALRRLGVASDKITVSWSDETSENTALPGSDELGEASRRRVEIRVTP